MAKTIPEWLNILHGQEGNARLAAFDQKVLGSLPSTRQRLEQTQVFSDVVSAIPETKATLDFHALFGDEELFLSYLGELCVLIEAASEAGVPDATILSLIFPSQKKDLTFST